MKPFHVFYLAGLCVGAVLLVTASWEFALEDLIPPSMSFLHGPESTEERLEHVITATVAAALVASIFSFIAFRAISRSNRSVRALHESEQRFRDYAESASEWFWEMGPDLRLSSLSSLYEKSTGIPIEKVVGKRRDELGSADPSEEHWAKHLSDLAARRPFRDFEYAQKLGDGSTTYYSVSGKAVFDRNGRFQGYRGTGSNITKRKEAEEALQRAHAELELRVQQRTAELERINKALETEITERKRVERDLRHYLAIVESSDDAVIAETLDGTIVSWNAAAEQIYGYTEDEMKGRLATFLSLQDRPNEIPDIIRGVQEGKRVSNYETVRKRKDGQMIDVSLTVSPVKDVDGRVIGLSAIARDITERKRAESTIREKDARLREVHAQLLHVSRVSAMGQMSLALAHELSQPLAAVANYTAAAKRVTETKGKMTEQALGWIEKAAQQAIHAGDIIHSLRRLLEKKAIDASANDINQSINEVASLALIGTKVEGVDVRLDLSENLPLAVIDKIQIQQVMFNLLRNSIEAMSKSKKRELTVSTSQKGDGIEVVVSDTGPGLPREVEEHLFQPFVTTKPKGMGIGLSICHDIIKGHGGKLWAVPNPDGGTVFSFTLPAAPVSETKHAKVA